MKTAIQPELGLTWDFSRRGPDAFTRPAAAMPALLPVPPVNFEPFNVGSDLVSDDRDGLTEELALQPSLWFHA